MTKFIPSFLTAFLICMCTSLLFAQGETQGDPIVVAFGTSDFHCIQDYSNTACDPGSTTYNLGAEPASGAMANDVWFQFTAPSETVKIRVCNPSFNASVEVYDNANTLLQTINNSTNSGPPGKEVGCVSGLHFNETYYVRIGRATSSGAGTFILNIEYSAVELEENDSPGPDGNTCYNEGDVMHRTSPCDTGVITTFWKIVDGEGNETITTNNGTSLQPSNFSLCAGNSYIIYCAVRAMDAECGNTHFGYSTGKVITICGEACSSVVQPANGDTLCVYDYNFQMQDMGSNHNYQWRFETDNQTLNLLSTINSSPFLNLPQGNYANDFVYGKTYHIYVRTWVCGLADNADWCDTGISFTHCSAPAITLNPSQPCTWISATNGQLTIAPTLQSDLAEYRFRLTPVESCTFKTTGTSWIGPWQSQTSLNLADYSGIFHGLYSVDIEARIVEHPCISCMENPIDIESLNLGWGPRSYVGIGSGDYPSAGTPVGCGCEP